jgi:glycosyltransferase involved in cell wall biosynthesis
VGRLLYLVHSLPPEEYTGTPLAAHGYARALAARGWEVTVVYPSPAAVSWAPQPYRRDGEAFTRIEVPPTHSFGAGWSIDSPAQHADARPPAVGGFRLILREVAPDLMHVVNNVHLPLDLPEVANAEGVPVVRSVTCAEDLCGLIAPVSPRSGPAGYCTPPLTPEQCARCVGAARPDLADAALAARLVRKRARAASQYRRVFDRVIFPTAWFRHYFEQTLPLDPARVRVVGMGMDLASWSGSPRATEPRPRRADGAPVVFCLAGAWDPVKLPRALVDAFTRPPLLERNDYRLVVLGAGHDDLVAPLRANPNVDLRGAYRADDLPSLLAPADVGLAPSYFETFHRVTREYLLAGLPVVGSRAGGIVDIIRHGTNGLLFDHAEPESLTRALIQLLDDRALLDRLTNGAARTPVRSLDEEADALAGLYDGLLAQRGGRRARGAPLRRPIPVPAPA